MKKKATIVVLAFSLVLCFAIGGSLAWLVDDTEKVTNTFSTSDINITLTETTTDYKMVPGNTIAKDPKVTVEAGSEDCWLFVKIEKSENYDAYLEEYEVAEGWKALNDENKDDVADDGVYYREVDALDSDKSFYVLAAKKDAEGNVIDTYKNGYVTVKTEVTKTMMNNIDKKTINAPTLSFTAYAVQKANITTAAEAWEIAKDSTTSSTT